MPERQGPRNEDELSSVIKKFVENADGGEDSQVSADRREAMDLYLGKPLGNEIEGRSQVVSSDVQDVVESVMPDLIQIFAGSDRTVRYEPEGPEDEEYSDQASDYANLIFNKDNPGFLILHDLFKDALLQIKGFVKVWWEERDVKRREAYTGLSSLAVQQLLEDEGVEAIEHEERLADEAKAVMMAAGIDPEQVTDEQLAENFPEQIVDMATVHDLTITRSVPKNRVRIMNIPPEEILISRGAKSIEDAAFVDHFTTRTVSDLVEDGYDAATLKEIPSDVGHDWKSETVARRQRVGEGFYKEEPADPSMREIIVHECYIKLDWDDDGVAELRKVTAAGPQFVILDNEAVPRCPIKDCDPIRMPHQFWGRSITDLAKDTQKIKTTLKRLLLDNMYNINNGRLLVSNKVSLEDVLDNKVGAPIRVGVDTPDVNGHAVPLRNEFFGQHVYPLLEYFDTARETTTGVNRLGQGLDPDALDSTAGGINMLLGRSQQRVLLIAQVLGFGVKAIFLEILHLIVENQDEARTIRLRNKWVQMDPRSWNAEMDVSVDVGLGRGTQNQQMVAMQWVLQIHEKIVALQGGPDGPLVGLVEIRNAIEKFGETIGLKNVDPYVKEIDPDNPPEQQQRPDPDMVKVQGQLKLEEIKMQGEEKLKRTEMMLEHQRKMIELGQDATMEKVRMIMEAAETQAEIMMKRRESESKLTIQAETARRSADIKERQAQQKGSQQ